MSSTTTVVSTAILNDLIDWVNLGADLSVWLEEGENYDSPETLAMARRIDRWLNGSEVQA